MLCQQPLRWQDQPNPMVLLPHQTSVNDCPLLVIEPGAAPASLISNSFRRRLKGKERKLQALPGYRYHVADNGADVCRLLDWFFRVKPERMAEQKLPNVFAEPGIEQFIRTACLAMLPVLPPDAVFSHLTAAALMSTPVEHRWPMSITVPPGAYRPRRRRVNTHVRDLTEDDVVQHRDVPITTGAQTWLDLAPLLPPGELVAVGDALFRAGHLDAARLGARLERAGGKRGIVVARELAPLLTPLAASRPESLVRYAVDRKSVV